MSFTTEQLTAIESAISSGELSVTHNGRSVSYRSMDDLLKARDIIRDQLRKDGSLAAKTRHGYISRRMD